LAKGERALTAEDLALATFRFYADLNDFLPARWRHESFHYPAYDGTQSIKHLIESIGVPHTETELIVVNGQPKDFTYLVQSGDRISVYPAFSSSDIRPPISLRPPLPNPVRFLLDNHLGKLARYLRLLGFDTLYFNNKFDDAQLAQLAQDEGCILLTRDRGLLKRGQVVYGYCLRSKDAQEQVLAVLHRFQITDQIDAWRRCLRCNGRLRPVAKERILDRLQPKTKLYYHQFQICETCSQIYWKGSHFKRLEKFLQEIAAAESTQNNRGDRLA
jgi:uncharacterized protein with PIN domain